MIHSRYTLSSLPFPTYSFHLLSPLKLLSTQTPHLTPKLINTPTDLLRGPRPRPLGPPRRLPSLRRRPLLHQLQRLPRHLAARRRVPRAGRGLRGRAGGRRHGGAGCAERAVCVCGRGGGFILFSFTFPAPPPFSL